MKKICIVLRVYNRIEDIELNLEIIRNTWKKNEYYIIVTCNGKSNDYNLTDKIYQNADFVLEIDNNLGHLKGSSQLLLESIKLIPDDCKYTILLEADTWIFSDNLIDEYVNKLDSQNAIWASARWYDRCFSKATDIAIVNSKVLLANTDIVNFTKYPECWVANYLIDHNLKSLDIKEFMPTLVPSYFKSFPYAPHGRFYIFPKGKMITHHIEDLEGGMEEKKYYFNLIAKSNFFSTKFKRKNDIEILRIHLFRLLSFLMIRKSWYRKREKLMVKND